MSVGCTDVQIVTNIKASVPNFSAKSDTLLPWRRDATMRDDQIVEIPMLDEPIGIGVVGLEIVLGCGPGPTINARAARILAARLIQAADDVDSFAASQ